MSTEARAAVVGDVGGTNVRLAIVPDLARPDTLGPVWRARCADFAGLREAVLAFLAGDEAPPSIAIAAAGPVRDGAVRLTNSTWEVSEVGLRDWGYRDALLLNDFAALAHATQEAEGMLAIGNAPAAPPSSPRLVMGPGTGLGAAICLPFEDRPFIIATEAGHVAFAPSDKREQDILAILSRRTGHVSLEHLLSGAGLETLHQVLAGIEGRDDDQRRDFEITRDALAGDETCRRTVSRFLAILASAAGDLALAGGATGGVYLGGGILPGLSGLIDAPLFRRRFENKGRMSDYLAAIPTWLITSPDAALVGAARALALV